MVPLTRPQRFVSGGGGIPQWCFSQVKGTLEDEIHDGELTAVRADGFGLDRVYCAGVWKYQNFVFRGWPTQLCPTFDLYEGPCRSE